MLLWGGIIGAFVIPMFYSGDLSFVFYSFLKLATMPFIWVNMINRIFESTAKHPRELPDSAFIQIYIGFYLVVVTHIFHLVTIFSNPVADILFFICSLFGVCFLL